MRIFLLLVAIATCQAVRVTVVPFPELGHFNPLVAVVQQLVNEDSVTAIDTIVPGFFEASCRKTLAEFSIARCVVFGEIDHHQYDDAFFERVTEAPATETFAVIDAETLRAQANNSHMILATATSNRGDVILCDVGMQVACGIVADKLDVPLVLLWPLVLAFPGITNPRVPALAAEVSWRMSWPQYLKNFLVQRLTLISLATKVSHVNALRANFSLPPVDALSPYADRVIITPSVFGLDVPQQLCPNVIPVGLLHRRLATEPPIPASWSEWLNGCGRRRNGLVYVNMGSVGRLPKRWIHMFEDALVNITEDVCILWKLSDEQQVHLRSLPTRKNTRLSHWLPFSPRSLLREKMVSVFVTHCGDTSVYESVEFGVPLVGFPLFADQPDMCQRVQDAGLGDALNKFTATSEALLSAILKRRETFDEVDATCSRLRNMSKLQGEARAAGRAVLAVAQQGSKGFVCSTRMGRYVEYFDLDILALCVALTWGVLILGKILCCRGR